jgi:hypothetical protein
VTTLSPENTHNKSVSRKFLLQIKKVTTFAVVVYEIKHTSRKRKQGKRAKWVTHNGQNRSSDVLLWSQQKREGTNELKAKNKTHREPSPNDESTFDTPLTDDEDISVLSANACCCDGLPNIPATGCCGPCNPTALAPGTGIDFEGELPKAA